MQFFKTYEKRQFENDVWVAKHRNRVIGVKCCSMMSSDTVWSVAPTCFGMKAKCVRQADQKRAVLSMQDLTREIHCATLLSRKEYNNDQTQWGFGLLALLWLLKDKVSCQTSNVDP